MPPKKGKKMELSAFLADESTGGSWADEMDALPTAPAPRDPNADSGPGLGGSHLSRNAYGDRGERGPRGGGFGDRDRGGFRDDRPPRVELPVPDRPPFNAYVGNLSFEVGQGDLEGFFSDVISVRMILDSMTGKPKGYGYVEFSTREGLVAALDKSGSELAGRTVRVSVAEPPKEREDRTAGVWRREGPLPPLEERRRHSGASGFPQRDRSYEPDLDRGERMGFGSKFVPSPDVGPGYRRNSGFRDAGDAGSDVDRGERMGFGSKFVPAPVSEDGRGEKRFFSGNGGPRGDDREPPVRGANFVPSPDPPGSRRGSEFRGPPVSSASANSWRSTTALKSLPSQSGPTSPSEHSLPTRRKLELYARTVLASGTSSPDLLSPASATSATAKLSPFGAARPVDSAAREAAIAEKLAAAAEKKTSEKTEKEKEAQKQHKPRMDPFGAAKPVDTLSREKEVDEKLAKDRAQVSAQVGPPGKPFRRWSEMSASGGRPRSPRSPKSETGGAKLNGAQRAPSSSASAAGDDKLSISPRSISLGSGSLRKQGVSFAALARGDHQSSVKEEAEDEAAKAVEGLKLTGMDK